MDNNDNSSSDSFQKLTRILKKIPPFAWPTIGMIALGAIIAIGFIMLIMAPTGVAEDILSSASVFADKVGNLFTFKGWKTDDEIASENAIKAEQQYYEKLESERKHYKDKYGIDIDTTLITATLFYARSMGDYVVDNGCDPNSDNLTLCDTELEDTEGPQAIANFYKKAKGHIKTLAKYMVIEVTYHNNCSTEGSGTTTVPEDPQKIAENSTGWIGFDHGNSKDVYKTTAYDYGKDPSEPGSCPYEDDGEKYMLKYKNSEEYETLVELYNNKESTCMIISSEEDEAACDAAKKEYNSQLHLFNEWEQAGVVNAPIGSDSISFNCSKLYDKNHYTLGVSRQPLYGQPPSVNACSQLPSEITRYMVDYRREGVYYYKLMTKFNTFLGAITGEQETFISKYYGDYVKNDDGTLNEENQLAIVNGIYDLYESMKGKGSSLYSADGDYASWSQCDSEWGSENIVAGGSICKIGCAATSLAIQVARSGTAVNIPNFNPGTFVEAMKAEDVGGFNSKGEINWDKVTKIAPNFHFALSENRTLSVDDIISLMEDGYYLVVQVKIKPETHFVAIDRVENGVVYMFDPSSNATDLLSKYTGMYGYRAFYKTD